MATSLRSAKDLKNIVAHSRMSNFPPVCVESEKNKNDKLDPQPEFIKTVSTKNTVNSSGIGFDVI